MEVICDRWRLPVPLETLRLVVAVRISRWRQALQSNKFMQSGDAVKVVWHTCIPIGSSIMIAIFVTGV
jgi:hypothetical protein